MSIAENLRVEQVKIKNEADELVKNKTDGFLDTQEIKVEDKGHSNGFTQGFIWGLIAMFIFSWIVGNFKSTNNPSNSSQVGSTTSTGN